MNTDKQYIDVSKFPVSQQNPCATGNWNVICVVYDNTMERQSTLWVNDGKAATFECIDSLSTSERVNFYSACSGSDHSFNGQIGTIEIYNSDNGFEDGTVRDRMTWLSTRYNIPRKAPV